MKKKLTPNGTLQTKNYHHISVMTNEVLTYLDPQPGKLYVDATFGGGGHTRAILQAEPQAHVLALDWDQEAIEHNAAALEEEFGDRCNVVWANYAHLAKVLKKENIKHIDGALVDLGTSQHQIHQKAGFSFQTDTPLDMRMSAAHSKKTAAHILNTYTEKKLADVLFEYGQEKQSRKIAHAVVEQRKKKRFETTGDLIEVIERIMPAAFFKAKHHIHPATRTFQALRIEVNDEFAHIHSFLKACLDHFAPDGKLVCISFHSLEDRIIKTFFKEHSDALKIITKKPIVATDEEIKQNPSSRSAKLRAAICIK
ncbi:MAG: 16S rRNA (cytosine(1402)-N(4))-methyltransferase RsmH [Epsilonproteobacteria bacterium]|nr:16S rRNA (cytosine(1402)-N(4))-methyltransferase RsmH [Campylobacterota bacterium]